MKIINNKFKGLFLFKNKSYKDNRGYFSELVRENVLNKKFTFQVMSYSKKNVVRGLHLQLKKSQGKFVSVLKGKIFDVAVDIRKNSKTYMKYFKCILSDKNNKSIYIPPGFAHGFYSFEKENIVIYGCTNYRDKKSEKGIKWNDPDLKIKWPNLKAILSNKDKKNLFYRDLLNYK